MSIVNCLVKKLVKNTCDRYSCGPLEYHTAYSNNINECRHHSLHWVTMIGHPAECSF